MGSKHSWIGSPESSKFISHHDLNRFSAAAPGLVRDLRINEIKGAARLAPRVIEANIGRLILHLYGSKKMRSVMAATLALAITAGSLTTLAQTRSKSKDDADEKKAAKYHRLPAHFGKLELKDDQVEEIYAIKADFGPEIDKLKEELKSLQEEMNEEIEGVLTSTQKSALAKLRSGSSRSTASASSSSRSRSSSTRKRSSSSRRKSSDEDDASDDE
jgi:hypothetical protein